MANISQFIEKSLVLQNCIWSPILIHNYTTVFFSETYFHFDKMQPGDSPKTDVSQIQRGLFGMIIVVIMI